MRRWGGLWIMILIFLLAEASAAGAQSFSKRFAKGSSSFGVQAGLGYTFDLPPGMDRTDITFLSFFPNLQRNLTGLVAKDSLLRGALYWHHEAGLTWVVNSKDDDAHYLLGWSPLMVQYKFLSPRRTWAPNLLIGGGFSMSDWKDEAERELGSDFQFLLHAGAGVEFFRKKGSYSFNYRLFHISNSNIQSPNVGLNAHVLSFGLRF